MDKSMGHYISQPSHRSGDRKIGPDTGSMVVALPKATPDVACVREYRAVDMEGLVLIPLAPDPAGGPGIPLAMIGPLPPYMPPMPALPDCPPPHDGDGT